MNQAITVTKILAIYDSICHDDKMAATVTKGSLKLAYSNSRGAKWQCLQIILGCESHGDTVMKVRGIANRAKNAQAYRELVKS